MSSFAAPLEGGDFLRRTSSNPLLRSQPAESPASFDIDRARREQRRKETQLRQLDKRIRSQRSRDRRSGTTTDFTDDLLRRDRIGEDLFRINTALRPERAQTTPAQVLKRRDNLQRQGLELARTDLDRATAPPSPKVIESIRRATEERAVQAAIAARFPGANVPADNLLPSRLNREAASSLLRQQDSEIDHALRRVDAFEGFGLTPAQAAEKAVEANSAAARRNTARAAARDDLSRLFEDEDAKAARLEATRQAVLRATEQRQIAALLAERRAMEQVGRPPQMSPLEQEELRKARGLNDLLDIEVAQARAELRRLPSNGPIDPKITELNETNEELKVTGGTADMVIDSVADAIALGTQGGFDEALAIETVRKLERHIDDYAQMPDRTRKIVAKQILDGLGVDVLSRNREGTMMQAALGGIAQAYRFDDGSFWGVGNMKFENQRMRDAAFAFIDRLQRDATPSVSAASGNAR